MSSVKVGRPAFKRADAVWEATTWQLPPIWKIRAWDVTAEHPLGHPRGGARPAPAQTPGAPLRMAPREERTAPLDPAPAPAPAPERPGAGPQILACAAVSLSLYGMGLLIHRSIPPAWDQPLLLRWLRTAIEHPVRTPLAVGLLLLAASRRAPPASARRPGGALSLIHI